MKSRIAALERRYIRQITELALRPVLYDIYDRWDQWVADELPQAELTFRSARLLIDAGLYPSLHQRFFYFLVARYREGRKPSIQQMYDNFMLK